MATEKSELVEIAYVGEKDGLWASDYQGMYGRVVYSQRRGLGLDLRNWVETTNYSGWSKGITIWADDLADLAVMLKEARTFIKEKGDRVLAKQKKDAAPTRVATRAIAKTKKKGKVARSEGDNSAHTGYCMSCRRKRWFNADAELDFANGNYAVQGPCKTCGTRITRMVGKRITAPAVTSRSTRTGTKKAGRKNKAA